MSIKRVQSSELLVGSKRKNTTNSELITNNSKGQTLIELVVVIAVMVIVIGALTFATIASLRNAQFSKNQAQATKLAQGGLELVRTGRDRNKAINSNGGLINADHEEVLSWNGDVQGNRSIWDYQIEGNCGDTQLDPPTYCYFNINNQAELNYLNAATGGPNQALPTGAESISPFNRVVIISDDPDSFDTQKTVTVMVSWTDFSGFHQSELTTVLRKK